MASRFPFCPEMSRVVVRLSHDNYGDDNVFSRDGMIHKFIEKFTCAKKNTLELRLEALEAKSPLTVQELEEKA